MTNLPVATGVATTSPDPQRLGYTTTEFWTATVVPTIFLFLAQFNVLPDANNPKLGGWILAGLGYAFYAISRGHMKKGAAIALAIREVFGGTNVANIASALQQVAPKQVADLEPLVSAIQAVDPEFSESQVEDLSNILHGIITHPQTKAQYADMINTAVTEAVKNVLSNANSPDVALRVAQTVQAVEDVAAGAVATTSPAPPAPPTTVIDATAHDGAEYVAPQFS